jgi:hypothetical protein
LTFNFYASILVQAEATLDTKILNPVAGDIGQIFFKKIIQFITVFLEGKFFIA